MDYILIPGFGYQQLVTSVYEFAHEIYNVTQPVALLCTNTLIQMTTNEYKICI